MKIILLTLFVLLGCNKEVIHPRKGLIVEAVYGLGIIRSENTYHAKSAFVNAVEKFHVKEGEDVKKGDLLFSMAQGQDYRAPFDGKVTDILVTIRENIFPQSIILSIVDLQNLYLEVSLEQQAAMQLRKGVKAEVSFEFFRSKKFSGEIKSIYPKSDQFVAKVLLEALPPGVLPGMTADVAFETARKENAVLIPSRAVANGSIVIKRSGQKKKLKVQIGLVDEEKTEIVSPELLETDEIILP